ANNSHHRATTERQAAPVPLPLTAPSATRHDPAPRPSGTRQTTRAASVRAVPPHHRGHGACEELEVPPQRPRRRVEQVEADHLLERDLGAAVDLPEAGQAGRDRRAPAEAARDLRVLGLDEGAWADQAHLAAQDGDELRQLIERGAAQEAADAGDPRVLFDLEHPEAGPAAVEVELRDLGLA